MTVLWAGLDQCCHPHGRDEDTKAQDSKYVPNLRSQGWDETRLVHGPAHWPLVQAAPQSLLFQHLACKSEAVAVTGLGSLILVGKKKWIIQCGNPRYPPNIFLPGYFSAKNCTTKESSCPVPFFDVPFYPAKSPRRPPLKQTGRKMSWQWSHQTKNKPESWAWRGGKAVLTRKARGSWDPLYLLPMGPEGKEGVASIRLTSAQAPNEFGRKLCSKVLCLQGPGGVCLHM